MPVDINELTEGWLELESDPGLFTLLLEDFGVRGVQVEEIYDLQKPIEGPIYGFIFLFRWIEERRSRRKVVDETDHFVRDEFVVNNIFFAQQMVPNSCATHALLSVLLNCPSLNLGQTLYRLKAHTSGMNPENKGWAIGNTPKLACAHNSHAMPQAKRRQDKSSNITTGRYTGEAFHFVSYVPIDGHLFELDGLKPFPIDHGPWSENEDWTEKFRSVITDRLGMSNGEKCQDICFNLMAVVPDRRIAVNKKLELFKTNREIVLGALKQLVSQSQSKKKCNSDGREAEESLEEKGGITAQTTPKANATEDEVKMVDFSTPLMIQTSPSAGSSTDTSSEVGSAFNSPQGIGIHSDQNSPTSKDYKKFVVIKVAGEEKILDNKVDANFGFYGRYLAQSSKTLSSSDIAERIVGLKNVPAMVADAGPPIDANMPESSACSSKTPKPGQEEEEDKKLDPKLCSKYPELFEPHTFAPKDLLALLKNLENEINTCEAQLKEENEKRRKYKVDDNRRTHNYDEFICTFLSMLAQQGKLTDLVQQHLLVNKKQGNGRIKSDKKVKSPHRQSKGGRRHKKKK